MTGPKKTKGRIGFNTHISGFLVLIQPSVELLHLYYTQFGSFLRVALGVA